MSFAIRLKQLGQLPAKLWARLGLRVQLVFFFFAVFGGLFTLFSAGMYHYISNVHRKEFDAALYNYAVDVGHALDTETLLGRTPYSDNLSIDEMLLPFSLNEMLLQIYDKSGQIILRSKSLAGISLTLPPNASPQELGARSRFQDVWIRRFRNSGSRNDSRYRQVLHTFHREGMGDFVIQAAVPMILLDRQQEGLLMFLSVSVPLTLLLAAFAGLALSRRALAPVAAITQKANEIEARRLSERIPVPERRDEIRHLALTLNSLLNRLEKAFKSQEDFTADASHQLKTPLAILKGELELFSRESRSEAELQEFLSSAKQEIDDLARMVEDLLILARADRYGTLDSKSSYRIDEKVMESVSRFSRYAEQRKISVSIDLHADSEGSGGFELEGEAELIRSLIENLLDNAIKYSPDGGAVSIVLEDLSHKVRLRVSDQGPGIPAEVLPHIFKRFYRAEATRQVTAGSGLGLAIVKRIAEIHSGHIFAEHTDKGTAFVLELPRLGRSDQTKLG